MVVAHFSLDPGDLDAIRQIVREEVASALASVSPQARVWLDLDGAAELLGYSRSYLRTAIKIHGIPHSRVGKAFRFRRGELEEWLAHRRDLNGGGR